jgi:hypothetical protein
MTNMLKSPKKDEVWWMARAILCVLPARSSNEIKALLHIAENLPTEEICSACAYALERALPESDAWEILEKEGRQSKHEDIRKAVEDVLKRKNK